MKKHADKCYLLSNVGIPSVQKEETECDCDGYHTFTELYDHRITLFIALCKQINQQPYDDDMKFGVWRSKTHSDGGVWDGWFILGIGMKDGSQITYHLPIERWDETYFAVDLETAPKWDGHTSDEVITRLKNL